MVCYTPLKAYRSQDVSPGGKRPLTFNPLRALEGTAIPLPCGQCLGCRIARSKEWATRALHEARCWPRNAFITLTFDDEHVPLNYSVSKREWQLFLKRLRDRLGPFRYLGCAEYGDLEGRPHYHGLLFNFDFPDKKLYRHRNGKPVFRSQILSEVWPYGFHEIGDVTYQSAAYVARYCMKKITGDQADEHYFRPSPADDMRMHEVEPEFATMSRRPGLGTEWYRRFKADAFPSDFIVVDGRKMRPPAFYLRKVETEDQELTAEPAPGHFLRDLAKGEAVRIKRRRKQFSAEPAQRWNSTPERLAVRRDVQQAKANRLVRSL